MSKLFYVFAALICWTLFSSPCYASNTDLERLTESINQLQDKPKLKAMAELSKLYVAQSEIGKGRLLANQGIELASGLNEQEFVAEFKLDRGSFNMDLFNYDIALQDFNAVVDYAKQHKNEDMLARALTKMGYFYGVTHRFDLAKKYMIEANEAHARLGNNIEISTNYNNLAVATTGEVKKILKENYYSYCQTEIKQQPIQELIQQQLSYYEKSKVIVVQEQDEYGVAIANLNLAVSQYCYSNDFTLASQMLSEAKKVFISLKSDDFLFFTLISEAQINYYEGRFESATALFEEAYEIALQFDAAFIYIYLYEYWLPLLIEVNDTEKALKFLYLYYHLKQLEQDQQSQAKSENARVIHEVDQKEQEITSLNYENKLKTQAIAQEKVNSRYQQFLIVTIVIILIAVSFLLRIKVKSERLIRKHNGLLEKTAMTDPLTGLSNRRALGLAVEREIALFKRHKTPFTIAILDVDHFKQINDTYGHLTGDNVLIKLAEIITNNIREIDLACRWGGEEVLILFPQANMEESFCVVSRILNKVKEESFESQSDTFSVNFTSGLAQMSEEISWADLCNQADQALYEGKNKGRGQVIKAK